MKFAIVLHLYYTDLWYYFLDYFKQLDNFDLYITLPEDKYHFKSIIQDSYINANVYSVNNKGRDVLPFLEVIKYIDETKYTGICKIHSKKSPHRSDGDKWRNDLIYNLIGDKYIVSENLKHLKNKIGIIGHKTYYDTTSIGSNKKIYNVLCDYYNIYETNLEFFAGTMFWLHPKILTYIKNFKIPYYLFDNENGKFDGAAEHGYERIFIKFAKKLNLNVKKTFYLNKNKSIKPIAFYLPQFHFNDYNDKWWGENYTEWTKVIPAKSLFNNHIIKHPTSDISYYNLEDVNIRRKQAKIAKEYNIYGFCYHHYWFNGKKFLEKPLELMLNDNEPNIPFCFNWANESLTRTWDGLENDVLLEQTYGSKQSWIDHINYLIHFFKHDNYIRINGKPIFLIYRISNIKKLNEMLKVWNIELQKNGFSGINIIQVLGSFKDSITNEFDDLIYGKAEFHPNILAHYNPIVERKNDVMVIDMNKNLDKLLSITVKQKNYFYGAFPSWDNTPRKGKNGLVYTNTTTKIFEKYIKEQVYKTFDNENDENFLFINAWNEWGEGCVLEPNTYNGYEYLNVIKNIQKYNKDNKKRHKLTKAITKYKRVKQYPILNNKKCVVCVSDFTLNKLKLKQIKNIKYDTFLSTTYDKLNGHSKDFKFVRIHNNKEFLINLNTKFSNIKSKNFINNAEEFYSAKILYLLLQNYKKTRSVDFDVIVYSNSLNIYNDELIIESISLTNDTIYYKDNKYWFGKYETMEKFLTIYDNLRYEPFMSFTEIVESTLKEHNINIVKIM